MGNTVKNLLVWLVLAVCLMAAFNAITDKQEGQQRQQQHLPAQPHGDAAPTVQGNAEIARAQRQTEREHDEGQRQRQQGLHHRWVHRKTPTDSNKPSNSPSLAVAPSS